MEAGGIGFIAEAVGSGRAGRFIRALGAGFFMLTMHAATLLGGHVEAACKAPPDFWQFCGYSQYDRAGSHKQRPPLGQAECMTAVGMLQVVLVDYSELEQRTWQPLAALVK
jgi:hypothetical protein